MASTTALLTTGFNEYVKQKLFYDVGGRMTSVIEARANAVDGDSALQTSYVYQGTSNRVDFMLEAETTWDGTWG
jgi:hypothetical protein